jgi:hypothetical protein
MRLVALLYVVLAARPAAALDVQIKGVSRPASAITAAIELRDLVPERFKKILDEGGVLHLRLEAELWESRPVWDRLVFPAMVRVFRFRRASSAGLSITDPAGAVTTHSDTPRSLPVALDLGDPKRVLPAERYYVHVVATLGTLAEREVDEVGDAVFGRPSEANGLGSLGRLMFRTVLQVSDYLQSVSAEAKGHRLAGAEILTHP